MNHYFWVKWKDAKKCEHVVGLLYYVDNVYHFRYNKEFQEKSNIPKNFNGIPSFGKLLDLDNLNLKSRVHYVFSSKELFSFFKMRIPKLTDERIWKNYGINDYSEVSLLAASKAKIPTDSFFVEEMDQASINELNKEYLLCHA